MKVKFFPSYFANLRKDFFINPVYNIIAIIFFLLSFLSVYFVFTSDNYITGSLVDKDPHKYEHKYKDKVNYEFYANYYFPDKDTIKRVKISEHTYIYAKKGDKYTFWKTSIFPEFSKLIFTVLSWFNMLGVIILIILFIGHFVQFSNSFFSTRNK